MELAGCKSVLNPSVVYSADLSKAVVPVLVLLFVALWFILRGDLFYVLTFVILFLCFSVLLVLRLPRLGSVCVCRSGGGGGGGGWSWCFSCVCSICAYLVLSGSSSSWCLERAAVCDCGTPWTFLLPFFYSLLLLFGLFLDLIYTYIRSEGLFYMAICFVLPCVILFLCFSVLLALRLPRLGSRES